MNTIQRKAECTECGRKILVFLRSIGSSHQFVDHIICAECLVEKGIDEKWAKDYPQEAKKLEAWIQGSEPKDLNSAKETR